MDQPQESYEDAPIDQPSEPAVIRGVVTAIGTLLMNGLVVFGVSGLTSDQRGYILTVLNVLAPIVAAVWIRSKVWSPASVERIRRYFQGKLDATQQDLLHARAETVAVKAAAGVLQGQPLKASERALLAEQRPAVQQPTQPQNGAQYQPEATQGMPVAPAPDWRQPQPDSNYWSTPVPPQPAPQQPVASVPPLHEGQRWSAPAPPPDPRGYTRRHGLREE